MKTMTLADKAKIFILQNSAVCEEKVKSKIKKHVRVLKSVVTSNRKVHLRAVGQDKAILRNK